MTAARNILLLVAFAAFPVPAFGYFYSNDFSSPLGAEWTVNWRYGMEGLLVDPDLVASSAIQSSNGALSIAGCPYDSRVDAAAGFWYNGFWTGNTVRLNNTYQASPTRPFGVEIIRRSARMNPDVGGGAAYPERHNCQHDIWIVEDNGTVANHRDYYPNFFLFYENATRGANSSPNNVSTIGWYDGTKHVIDLTNATNAFGSNTNICNTNVHTMNFRYQWKGDTYQSNFTFENGEITNGSVRALSAPTELFRTVITNGVNGLPIAGNFSLLCSNTNVFGRRTTQTLQITDIDFRGRTNASIGFKLSGSYTNQSRWRYITADYRGTGALWIPLVTNTNFYNGTVNSYYVTNMVLPIDCNDANVADFRVSLNEFTEVSYSNFTFENGAVTNGGGYQWAASSANLERRIITNGVNGQSIGGTYSLICSNIVAGARQLNLNNIDLRDKTNCRFSFKMSGSANMTNTTGARYLIVQYRSNNAAAWVTVTTNTNIYDGVNNYHTDTNFIFPDDCVDNNEVDLRFNMVGALLDDHFLLDDVILTYDSKIGESNAVIVLDDFTVSSTPFALASTNSIDNSDIDEYWIPGPNYTNTNAYGIRLVHDGNYISVYINPDPDDNDAYPNEYCLVARKQVLWSNNIRVLIGHEVMNQTVTTEDAEYERIRIASAASESALAVFPTRIYPSTNATNIVLMLSNTIDAVDAGINVITITKPPDFMWSSGPSNDISVSNAVLGVLTNMWMDAGGPWTPAVGQAGIRTNGSMITILLPSIVTHDAGTPANEHIFVTIRAVMSNRSFVSNAFTASVEARQFNAMPTTWGRSSTCGPEVCTGSAAVVVQKNPAEGYFGLAPAVLGQDDFYSTDPVFSMKLSASLDDGYEPIRQAAILIPNEFALCTFSNFNSSKRGVSITNNITFGTIPGISNLYSSNCMIITYPTNDIIFSPGDYDFITFTVFGVPFANTNTNDANFIWRCYLDSSNVSAGSMIAATNDQHLNQRVLVSNAAAKPWDIYITQVRDRAAGQAVRNVETPVISFDAHREGQLGGVEYITAIAVTNIITNRPFYGFLSVYTNSSADTAFSNGVIIASNWAISNLSTIVLVTNFSNATTNNPDARSRFWVTFTPTSFDSLATAQFQITAISATGADGGVIENSNKFTNYAPTVIKLEDSTLIAAITSLMPSTIKQGAVNVPALRIGLRCLDEDATFSVQSLRFTIASSNLNQGHISLSLFRDNGSSPGVYDAGDSFVTGSDGVFNNGEKTAVFASPVTIDKNETIFYAMLTAHADAAIASTFSVSLPRTQQTGIVPVGVVITNDGGINATATITVFPSIAYTDPVAAARTMIRPANGERVMFYIDDTAVTDPSRYTAYIYDVTGKKVQEIPFTSHVASWDAKSIGDQLVRSGIYIAIIRGPNNYSKKIKLMVLR